MHEQKTPALFGARGFLLGRCRFNPGRRAAGSAARCREARPAREPRACDRAAGQRGAGEGGKAANSAAKRAAKRAAKVPQKCRKTSGQARDEALPGFFFARFATRRRGRSIRAAHRRVPRASRFAAPSRFNAGLALECGIDVRHRRRAVRQRARSIASVAASPAEQPRRPLNADRPAARRNRVPRGECRSAHPSRPSCR